MSLTDAEFTSIKNKCSEAYLYSVLAKVNYAVEQSHRDYDGLKIDYSIINHKIGTKRTIASECNEIKIQLKSVSESSASMFKDYPDYFKYRIDKKIIPIGPAFYIVVVVLPKETNFDEWVKVTTDELILKKCAYYFKVEKTLEEGFISVDKSNLFTPDTLPLLFISAEKKEEYL